MTLIIRLFASSLSVSPVAHKNQTPFPVRDVPTDFSRQHPLFPSLSVSTVYVFRKFRPAPVHTVASCLTA